MPNRLLKEGIVDSDKINTLSAEAEVFFYRLLVVSDDYGRMDARPQILRARCFPLKEVTGDQISEWLHELETAKGRDNFGLVICYEIDGFPYLQIMNWDQRQRSHGKYPAPTDEQLTASRAQSADNGQKSAACGGLGLGLGQGKGKGKGETRRDKRAAIPAIECPDGVDPQVWSDWLSLRKAKRAPVTQTVLNGAISEAAKAGMSLEAFLVVWCRRGSQGLEASWLKPEERTTGVVQKAGKFDPIRYVNDKDYAAQWDAQKGGANERVIDIN